MEQKQSSTPTEQGKYKVGNKRPPLETRFGGPRANPRHNGAWKKEDTPRYKLEQMMKLPEKDLRKVVDDKDAPYFERKIANCLAKGDWKTLESMINQVYGQPSQTTVNVDAGDHEEAKAFIRGVFIP